MSATGLFGGLKNASLVNVDDLLELLQDPGRAIESRFQLCLSAARERLNAERGCLFLTHPRFDLMLFDGDEELNLRFPFSRSVVGEAMTGSTGLVSFESEQALRSGPVSSMAAHGVRAALCAPIIDGVGNDHGVIYFDTRLGQALFSKEQLEQVKRLADQMGRLL